MRSSSLAFLSKLALLSVLTSTIALKSRCENSLEPPTTQIVLSTNRYHLPPFAWDTVTNATGYQVIVQYSGVETQRISTATNWLVVSNLTADLDNYRFTCVATNATGTSAESEHAPLRLITILERDSLNGPLRPFTTPVFEPTNSGRLLWPSNWNAASLLQTD
jgi:hypothetical protein